MNGVITADSNNTGTPEDARRVVGLNGIDSASAGTLTKNVANEYMALNPTPDPLENTAAGRDGEDVDTTPDQSVFEALGWDFSASGEWVMGSDGYPSLR